MKNVVVYERTCCRGDLTSSNFEIAIELIDKAIAAREEYKDTRDVPQWVEEVSPFAASTLLATIIMDEYDYINEETLKRWNETRSMGIEAEEQAFGVGHNLRAAKISWVDLDSDLDC